MILILEYRLRCGCILVDDIIFAKHVIRTIHWYSKNYYLVMQGLKHYHNFFMEWNYDSKVLDSTVA